MRNNVWKKSILILVSLFVVLSFVNIVGAGSGFKSDNDSVITSTVVDKLQSDSQLMGSSINVDTKNGEVTLKGAVNSEADITRAAQLARSIDGVKHVDNRLTTVSAHRYPAKPGMTNCQIGANWEC